MTTLLIATESIDTWGWDPGKDDNEACLSDCETVFACPDYDLLLLRPTLLHRDVTTTEMNIRVPLPLLNPSASMRARQDEDNDEAPARPSIDTWGWDPGRQNGLHLLLLHPTILRRDATTTELNIRVPLPLLNPSASMRARQDEDNDNTPARPSIDTWDCDPGKDEAMVSLSACETIFACPDYNDDLSTFTEDFDVAGEISGSDRRR